MRELREILARARTLRAAGTPAAVATIVAVEGSSYRREGARLLFEPEGGATGVLSGGCLERDLARAAAEVVAGGAARTVVYDLSADDEAVWGLGLGCSGRVTLLVEPLLGVAGEALERALSAAIEERRESRVATVYAASGSNTALCERFFLVQAGRDEKGKPGKGFNEREDPSQGSWWADARTALEALPPGSARSARLAGRDGSWLELLLESVVPPVRLVVVGAERDVVPLVRLGGEMGWECVVVDSRSTAAAESRFSGAARFVVVAPRDFRSAVALDSRSAVIVATHRYLDDLAFLGEIASAPIEYLGLLGPEKRRARLLDDLGRQGVALDATRLRGPAGLALGGRSPHEVALAIVAEIQAALHGGTGRPLCRDDAEEDTARVALPSATDSTVSSR